MANLVKIKKGTPLTINYMCEKELVVELIDKGDNLSQIRYNGFNFMIPTKCIIGTISNDEKEV